MSELHETVHWRKMKRIITLLARAEDVNIEKYNLSKITCYRTYGSEMNRKELFL